MLPPGGARPREHPSQQSRQCSQRRRVESEAAESKGDPLTLRLKQSRTELGACGAALEAKAVGRCAVGCQYAAPRDVR